MSSSISRGVPTADCTSGLAATQTAITTATNTNAIAVASHHRQARYATTGKDTVQKRANSLHSGACAPVTADRARATRLDNLPTSTESDDTERTIERWVDTLWYSSTSSSISAPDSRRRRLTSWSSRSHVDRCASTNASTSTSASLWPVAYRGSLRRYGRRGDRRRGRRRSADRAAAGARGRRGNRH